LRRICEGHILRDMRYTVKAAAIATGISTSRLRTWERRYGIPKPSRSSSGRRLYDEHDLEVIRRMAALVAAGVPASQAAEAARTEEIPSPARERLPVRDHPLVEEMVKAALSFEEPAITRIVREAVGVTWEQALEEVLFPALNRIGEGWGEGSLSCATEHFTTEVIRREIAGALAGLPDSQPATSSALLACAEDERHELGLLAMALLLRLRGLRVFYLGSDVPAPGLLFALQRTKPDAVCLSATTAGGLAALGRTARTLISSRLSVRLFVGGPAFSRNSGHEPIPGIRLPHSIRAAADVMADSLQARSDG
jgi:DNA-binding transcriptional MerR regulator